LETRRAAHRPPGRGTPAPRTPPPPTPPPPPRPSKARGDLFPPPGPAPAGTAPTPDAAAQALRRMAEAVHKTPSRAEAQKTQLQAVANLLGARSAFLVEYAPLRDRLEVAAVRGRNEARISAVHPQEGPVGEAFAEARVVREDDLTAVPIQGAHGPLGVLAVMACKVDAPDALLEVLAAQMAAAWEHARLREDTARREKDLQTALAGLKSMERNRE